MTDALESQVKSKVNIKVADTICPSYLLIYNSAFPTLNTMYGVVTAREKSYV